MTRGDGLSPGAAAAAARVADVISSQRTITMTEATALGIENVLAMVAEYPVKVTKRGKPIGVLYSWDDARVIDTGVAQFNAAALRVLAEMVERLTERELWSLSQRVADMLGVPESHR